MRSVFLLPALAIAVACAPSQPQTVRPAEEFGLVAVRDFPGPGDICQVIGETDLTTEYLDDSATLVGCPKRELGAIADRQAEGGVIVDQVGDWVLISVPDA